MKRAGRSALRRFALATMLIAASARAEALFEWNVFLGPWQVIGPFPKSDEQEGSGLRTDYLKDESRASLDTTVELDSKRFTWQAYDGRLLNFTVAFKSNKYIPNAVAYARTAFVSDRDQDAVLAIGSDDGVRAWLNGELILEQTQTRGTYLDDDRVPVRLRRGENVLLLKVENGPGPWGAIARLLPADVERPLLSFEWSRTAALRDFNHYELPDLIAEFLDPTGRVTSQHRVSGFRARDHQRPQYRLYAAAPASSPDKIRIRIDQPGYRPFETIVDWDQRERFPVETAGDVRLTGRVVDEQTGQPVADARFLAGETVLPVRSTDDGRFEINGLDPFVTSLQVAAAGYQTRLAWTASVPLEVKLVAGGRVLRGRVTDETGRPIANANVWLSTRWPQPRAITDADGRFVLSGLRETDDEVSPVVEHPDFAPLMHFSERLTTNEVVWKMQRGMVVTGRVIEKSSGKPIRGVRVVAGEDRFGNNTAIPEAVTDSDGRYRLSSVPPEGAILHAMSDQFAPAMQTVTTSTKINFELERGADVTGRVMDTDGQPIAGVWVISDTWSGARMFDRRATTDADGRFRLPHMPTTTVELDFVSRNYVNKRDFAVVGGQHYEIVLEPVIQHTVRVRLKDSERVPRDVQIEHGYRWDDNSDRVHWESRRGHDVQWNSTNGVLTVVMDEAGNYERLYRFRVAGYKAGIVAIPRKAKTPQALEVVLDPSAQVRGRVVDAKTGEPLPGVTVVVVGSGEKISARYIHLKDSWDNLRFAGQHVKSAADGSFELTTPEPGADILLIKEHGGFHFIRDANSVIEEGAMELPFPAPATLRGQVRSAGKPVANESLNIHWRPPADDEKEWEFPFQFGGNIPCDEHGRFEVAGLGPGRYRIGRVREFKRPGSGGMSMYVDTHDLILLPGQTLDFDLDRPPGFEFKGRTLDSTGKPLGNCVVRLFETDERRIFEAAQSDSEGNFTIADVPKGSFQLMAEHYSPQVTRGCGLGDQDGFANKMVAINANPTTMDIRLQRSRRTAPTRSANLTGNIPPDFTAHLLNSNTTFTLSEQLGKVVALDFWATWCGPCMKQLPEVKTLWQKYRDNPDVVFLTVSLDQDTNQLARVLRDRQIDFPVIFSGGEANDNVAAMFGVQSIPTSIVIDRNGRFAAEPAHGGQFASLIEAALARPVDPVLSAPARLPRIEIEVAFDEDGTSVPEVELELVTQEKTETLAMPGSATKLRWPYPGGNARISASAPGLAKQTREVTNAASVSFRFKSPRMIRGQLVVEGNHLSTAGLKVNAVREAGTVARSTTSDRDGRFSIPAVPGTYYLIVEGNDRVAAPMPSFSGPTTVDVGDEEDPPEQRLVLSRAVTIRGRVEDSAGKPVPGAKVVSAGRREPVTADADGKFLLPGIPASGPVMLFAGDEQIHGSLQLPAVDPSEEYVIQLGKQDRGRIAAGKTLPAIKFTPLNGGPPGVWQPERESLVVFCALWHPAGRRLLRDAMQRAKQTGLPLVVFSTDWTLEQAARHRQTIPSAPEVLFVGAGDPTFGLATAFDVAADGRVLKESSIP